MEISIKLSWVKNLLEIHQQFTVSGNTLTSFLMKPVKGFSLLHLALDVSFLFFTYCIYVEVSHIQCQKLFKWFLKWSHVSSWNTNYTCLCICVCTCMLVHSVACSPTCGYIRAKLYLHMRIHWLSPPLLLQGYPPHPHNASYQHLMPRRCAHTHTAGVCLYPVSIYSIAHIPC